MVYSCSKCHKAITEPMVFKCDNRFWHSSCLTCQMCGHTPSMVGEQSMYMFRGSLICKNDYMRINCVCKTCSRPLSQSDMVIKANGYGYMHDKCVYCGRCQHRLETGDRFMLTTDQMIVCQKCIMQQHPQGPPPIQIPSQIMTTVSHMHQPPPPHYSNHHIHSQQHLGSPNHHGLHSSSNQLFSSHHSHHNHQSSSSNYSMMAQNGYLATNNGNLTRGVAIYGNHQNMTLTSTGSNGGGGSTNGLSRATPPSTPNNSSNISNTTGGTGGGRRGRKRNTQVKDEF
ncbi:LIM domain transcription factor LMO4-B [Sarcoptes scabiei]|uniref:LIM domain transcription factor LMO4-B n=1 Tax=Sarcoptes scabiei TaxID=52283 RepID=A0A834RHX6_SARSC|nr:LIM domain transcription factor LMO4-B [Sarcoptes scabiei]UXI20927.1 cohesin subunit SMC3 [Sarcoptes scabiei]